MGIQITDIRIDGFRGLNDFEMSLDNTTLLTGINNVGKTSVLKALQLALGSRGFLTYEDLNVHNGVVKDSIIIDLKFSAIDASNQPATDFDEIWEIELKADNIKFSDEGFAYVPLRFKFDYDETRKDFNKEILSLSSWQVPGIRWQDITTNYTQISLDAFPFFYIDAKRDILDDIKNRASYLGRMLASVKDSYDEEDIEKIEKLINKLNAKAIKNSDILKEILKALKGIDSALDKKNANIDIMPFAKSLSDINKTVTIHYGTRKDSFSMDYHGMGTRSWSSLLIFKAFVDVQSKLAEENSKPFFPIIAVEEPESHLHPNAQKKLYSQLKELSGQKIISTHSPSVACSAELFEIRCLYKDSNDITKCGILNVSKGTDEERKIKMKVMATRGELLFSKAIVLFEGETEEYLLPALYRHYFHHEASFDGIDMISVGGSGKKYSPFVSFATAFNIPWYIFSDGEENIINKNQKALREVLNDPTFNFEGQDNIFILPNNYCIEQFLLSIRGVVNSLKAVLKDNARLEFPHPLAYAAQESRINALSNEDILKNAKSEKTKYSVFFAKAIEQSNKIPPLIKNLFNKLKLDLSK